MNQRLMTILLSAFVIAAGASYVVYRLVGKQIGELSRNRPTKLVVAATNLEIGAVIKATDVKAAELVGKPPQDAVLTMDAAVGRGVLTPIYEGEPVIGRRLAPVGSGGGLAVTIPAGMRACAVKVDSVVGVAGFVLPGMRVDVLISGTAPGDERTYGTRVKTLLQNIEVLSAGKNFQPDREGKPVEVPVVNLLVAPAQAEILSLASNHTHIQLVLRNPLDHQLAEPPGTDLADLFGKPQVKPVIRAPVIRRAAASPPAPPVVPVLVAAKPVPLPERVIQMMNGGKHTEQRFPGEAN